MDPSDLEDTLAADDVDASAGLGASEDARPRPGASDHAIEQGTAIGRYVVLSRIGAGAMGVVYAAYDPELDRKVALKLLRSDARRDPLDSGGRTRLLREAQALAKLAHPNVVTVHDVGTKDGRVWIAMEFVEGQTLGAWLSEAPRRWPEIVEVIDRAGRGLAAAHAAGLLHRDLKPDNVMIGVDGRVRVMDFGLARVGAQSLRSVELPPVTDRELGSSALSVRMTQTGAMMGTPAYMAPEQMRGQADARSDQFSLCVTLWEALYGERPFTGETLAELVGAVLRAEVRAPPSERGVPRWLRRVCLRGLATAPESRFASIDALLLAIERGRTRRRQAWVLAGVAGLVAVGAGVEGMRRHDHTQSVAACASEGARIEADWNDAARARVRAGLLATGSGEAETTADKVMPWLDAGADEWQQARTEACMRGHVHEQWAPAVLERAQWCLDERRLELVKLVAQLEQADVPRLNAAVPAASGLLPSTTCLDTTVLDNLPRVPAAADRAALEELLAVVAEIEALASTAKYVEGLERVQATRAEVERLGWPPLVARLRRVEGALLQATAAYERAEQAFSDAYMIAAKAGAWDVASKAANSQVRVVGYSQARYAEGRLWSRLGEVAEALAGDPLRLRAADRLGNLAAIAFLSGAVDEASDLSERALTLSRAALGEEHPTIATQLANLGVLEHRRGQHVEAVATLEHAVAMQERLLGPMHPNLASNLNNLGLVVRSRGRLTEARALMERALSIREQALEPDHPDIAASLDSLGGLDLELGEYDDARASFERALAIREKGLGTKHPSFVGSLNNLANLHSQLEENEQALRLYERAAEILEQTPQSDESLLSKIMLNIAHSRARMKDYERAYPQYRSAIARLERHAGPAHPDVAAAWRWLGSVYAEDGRLDQSIDAYEHAVAIYDGEPGDGTPLDVLEAPRTRFWLAQTRVLAGRPLEPAVALAERARAELIDRASEGNEALRLEIDAWLNTHRGG